MILAVCLSDELARPDGWFQGNLHEILRPSDPPR